MILPKLFCCFFILQSVSIVGCCKFVGVVNLWILLIYIKFMHQSKFTRCLSVNHLPKHKRFVSSLIKMPRV